ncbi:hypothetical protein A6D6_03532 [Alcanivorax xiamenensis]|uniref:Circularly permuted ATP-grasp type 2 domain-containing protein n=1 Tax=Alcanivorax xiamenensis TaxID=1177156 RepID=A0ABQ6Y429_9GAMM|nr:circularly permuted type 2 ATP-grasp protein [Alcanivorax xiamenensis]KAF0803950.1 hypothetical protein A6D6_03532 [Alcanivorax xiamenensis]
MLSIAPPVMSGFDEMFAREGAVRPHYSSYHGWLLGQSNSLLQRKRQEAELLFHRVGITFNVYGEESGAERLIPFDVVPRIIPEQEWRHLEQGTAQRVRALNRFLDDIYHGQDIIRAGRIPADQIYGNAHYQPCMQDVDLPNQVYSHVSGVDLIRDGKGTWYVLEDNLRTPSGVSYMIENRRVMMRLFPELFAGQSVAPVEHYPSLLLDTLQHSSAVAYPTVVLLTPGRFNSAYFEHAFLAQQMGIELVEGADLFVKDAFVYMRTTAGPQRVDVIYRRIDDDFLDPLAFNPESMLGVPGLLSVYRQGNVVLANAIGSGVGDDKSIYPYVPEMIRFYLGEEPILENVPTRLCRRPEDLEYVLEHLPELVVKEVHGAGGYGMLVGPAASREEIESFRQRLRARPDNYIAQPTLSLSTCPIFVEQGIAPRHIDLRPFVLSDGRDTRMVPGGLTRVAMNAGSLVVNSSQGGGTKDTWVVEAPSC